MSTAAHGDIDRARGQLRSVVRGWREAAWGTVVVFARSAHDCVRLTRGDDGLELRGIVCDVRAPFDAPRGTVDM